MSLCNLGQRLRVLCWPTDVDLIVVHLNLEARGEKRVEPYNQVGVAFEEVGHSTDNSRSVDTTRIENQDCHKA